MSRVAGGSRKRLRGKSDPELDREEVARLLQVGAKPVDRRRIEEAKQRLLSAVSRLMEVEGDLRRITDELGVGGELPYVVAGSLDDALEKADGRAVRLELEGRASVPTDPSHSMRDDVLLALHEGYLGEEALWSGGLAKVISDLMEVARRDEVAYNAGQLRDTVSQELES